MRRMIRFVSLFILGLFASLTIWAGNEDPRFASWPSYVYQLKEDIVNQRVQNTLEDVNRFMAAAKKSGLKDCLSYAYYYQVFYYTVVTQNIQKAEAIVRMMQKEKMNELDITKSKFDIIYYYQITGQSAKAIAVCRTILNTTHDKSMIAEAHYNILLLYENMGMYDYALREAYEMCRFAESITEPRIYHYGLANFNSCAADMLTETGRYEEALPYLVKTDSILMHDGMISPSSGFNDMRFVIVSWGNYYLGMNDDKSVWRQINKLKSYHNDPLLAYAYELEAKYYLKHNNYAKAQASMDSMLKVLKRCGISYCDAKRTLMRAEIAKKLGKYQDACNLYGEYVTEKDSMNRQADELKTFEYAAKMNVNKANVEKSEYKARAEYYRILSVTITMIVILLAFAAAVFIILSLRRMNKKLSIANQKLQKAYNHVDQLNKMKNSFIENMSHEIRTPLNSIVGFAEILGSCSDEYKHYADIISKNSYQLTNIVDHVLSISDIESAVMEMKPTDIDACCREVVQRMNSQVPEGVELVYEPAEKGLVVQSDGEHLQQVLINLLENSIKFTKEGEITLGYTIENSRLHLYVKDTGPGIPADKVEWVFERFTKLNHFALGSGLGLSACQMIVERLNGRISIDTSYHEGCKVDVWLPIR